MTDLGDLLGLAEPPRTRGRRRVRCRNPLCLRWVYVDRLVCGYGEDCAEERGLVVHRGRRADPGQSGWDLLDELAAGARP